MTDPGALVVRRARAADVEAIRELVRAAYDPYVARIGRPPAPMAADYAAVVGSGHAWTAHRGRELVGVLVLIPRVDHLVLDTIAVAPPAQGVGVGVRLMRLAEDQARALGLRQMRSTPTKRCTRTWASTRVGGTARRGAASRTGTGGCSS